MTDSWWISEDERVGYRPGTYMRTMLSRSACMALTLICRLKLELFATPE